MPDELKIAILAAGASRRLGRPKQLVMIDGKPLLRRQCEIAIEAGIGRVAVILGCSADACRAAVDDLPVTIAVNDKWVAGLGTSIACAARSALPPVSPLFPLSPLPVCRGRVREGAFADGHSGVDSLENPPPPQPSPGIPVEGEILSGLLLLHCDQYAISVDDLRSLYKVWDVDRSKAVRSRSGSYLGPPVIFPESSFDDLRQLSGDDGAKSVVIKLGSANVVAVDIPSALFDLDTPEQLAAVRSIPG